MNKNKKKAKSDIPALIDTNMRGTIIVGTPRLGTHFLLSLCRHRASHKGLDVIDHGEININVRSPKCVLPADFLAFMANDAYNQYRLVIINHEQYKTRMINDDEIARGWHLIRLVDHDKRRWFWSWFWFMHSPLVRAPIYPELMNAVPRPGMHAGRTVWIDDHDGRKDVYDAQSHAYLFTRIGEVTIFDEDLRETNVNQFFGHHGSPRTLYDRFLKQLEKKLPLSPLLKFLPNELHNHLLSKIIPVDEEIQYQSLSTLQNQEVPWQPNDYADITASQVFENADLLEAILDRWSVPFAGKFKANT